MDSWVVGQSRLAEKKRGRVRCGGRSSGVVRRHRLMEAAGQRKIQNQALEGAIEPGPRKRVWGSSCFAVHEIRASEWAKPHSVERRCPDVPRSPKGSRRKGGLANRSGQELGSPIPTLEALSKARLLAPGVKGCSPKSSPGFGGWLGSPPKSPCRRASLPLRPLQRASGRDQSTRNAEPWSAFGARRSKRAPTCWVVWPLSSVAEGARPGCFARGTAATPTQEQRRVRKWLATGWARPARFASKRAPRPPPHACPEPRLAAAWVRRVQLQRVAEQLGGKSAGFDSALVWRREGSPL